jgi:hypothetical protein
MAKVSWAWRLQAPSMPTRTSEQVSRIAVREETGFYDNERAGQAGTRNHVAETQSEERGSAQVGIGPETGVGNRDCHIHGGTGTVLHKSEAEDQSDRPDGNQHEKR